jgi:hypothetical protein
MGRALVMGSSYTGRGIAGLHSPVALPYQANLTAKLTGAGGAVPSGAWAGAARSLADWGVPHTKAGGRQRRHPERAGTGSRSEAGHVVLPGAGGVPATRRSHPGPCAVVTIRYPRAPGGGGRGEPRIVLGGGVQDPVPPTPPAPAQRRSGADTLHRAAGWGSRRSDQRWAVRSGRGTVGPRVTSRAAPARPSSPAEHALTCMGRTSAQTDDAGARGTAAEERHPPVRES